MRRRRAVVADLVRRQPGVGQPPPRVPQQPQLQLLGHRRHPPQPPPHVQRGVALVRQPVAAHVPGPDGDPPLERRRPRRRRLPRHAEDQVDRQPVVREPRRPGGVDGPLHVVRVVVPLEHLQRRRVERLRPEAQPVHAAVTEHPAVVGVDGRRVGLDRELGDAAQVERLTQPVEQPRHLAGRQQRRRPAAEEHGAERRRPRPHRRLGQQQVHEPRHPLGRLPRDRVEVAVVALVEAERDVDVQGREGRRVERRRELRRRGIEDGEDEAS